MPSKTGWIRHLTCSITVALALAGSASTALAADGAAASSAWTCRASAGYVNIVGNGQSGHVEPIGANGDVATGADNPQCKTDGQGSPDITLGDPQQGEAVETGPREYTAINPGLTYQQRPGASGEIEHLVLAGGGHLLTADVAQSIGLAGCAGPGAPRLYGASQVANLMVDGHAIKDPGTQQTVVDQPNLTVT